VVASHIVSTPYFSYSFARSGTMQKKAPALLEPAIEAADLADRQVPLGRGSIALTAQEGSRISRANCAPARPEWAQIALFRARQRRQLRETDLSAEQIGAQAPSRLSRPHGDQERAQGCSGAAYARTQAAQRVIGARPRSGFAKFRCAKFRCAEFYRAEFYDAMERLKRRTDFRAAASGARAQSSGFVLQARKRSDEGTARVGFTVSRQVGNAVERNRVRRRLRELVRLARPGSLHAGHDYVLVGRRTALAAPFRDMMQELEAVLDRIHSRERRGGGGAHKRPLHEAGSAASVKPIPQPDARRNPSMPER
jgi:ribonuclease P protein component